MIISNATLEKFTLKQLILPVICGLKMVVSLAVQ